METQLKRKLSSVSQTDSLSSDSMLNDEIMDNYFGRLSKHHAVNIHCFSQFFYSSLVGYNGEMGKRHSERGYDFSVAEKQFSNSISVC